MKPFPAVRRLTSALLDGLESLVFPMSCVLCERDGLNSPFCESCRASLLAGVDHFCPRCAFVVGPWARLDSGCSWCRGRSLGFDAALALARYEGPMREACLEMKHDGGIWLAPWLAELMVDAHHEVLRAERDACVVPVPLHWRRHWSRGHNQAAVLAHRIARRLHIPYRPLLRRRVATPALAELGRTERARVMRNVFQVQASRATTGTVILVDDIMTTGATCGSAARALKRAGARRVVAVVAARAGRSR